ncbi:S1C family serine protease [uncultured Microbacterium sp.]|uniref:PDZ/DHR/GLGF domain protein n=1 Tax=uncultured Microbacterium sp. TaxID=191216 RepID=A0A1Y5P335_9MICO|nr:trypsin-like peptidase domain-containing protein [uncultured Microbacterium sp.]SBS70348.1 PDZ/DHR/GLGF domain protein [uncultured Microbacterium sp.]
MSDNAASTNEPQNPAQEPALESAPAAAGIPPRPPLPPQAPDYAAQQPYTAPQAPAYAPTAADQAAAPVYPTQPTQPYGETSAEPIAEAPPEGGKVGAGKIVAIMVAAALVGGASGLGAAAAGGSLFPSSQTVVQSGPSTVTVNDSASVNQTTAIATKVLPSVVTISASSSSAGGTGSGVVLSADGYVVTNTHVVTLDGATGGADLKVTTSDGKVYTADVVGLDPMYDLAVIKLDGAEDLTPIEIGDSGDLNVGDGTIAIGAPLGLSNTVTTGIVSALNRSIQIASSAVPETEQDTEQNPDDGNGPFQFDFGQGEQQSGSTGTISIAVIQTDAAINPGNSGGALVDDEGKLIGINVAIATAGGSSSSQSGSIGVGFSIPSNIVQRVTDEIIADGEATHGLLGAMVGDAASQEDATTAGAYISEVTGGGAADEAGLKAGDIVTQFDGVPISDATDLTAQVRALAAGSSATVVYLRDGKAASVEVTLGELSQ